MKRIGIICPSEIAFRRFMPALQKCADLKYVGIACSSAEEWFGEALAETDPTSIAEVKESEWGKALNFQTVYGGEIFDGYETLIKSNAIDAVYIPLPPALHHKWAKLALEHGKHVFVEKPSTTSYEETKELVQIAEQHGLVIHENYMFIYHDQLKVLDDMVASGIIGDIRFYRISFGFPRRAAGDFRYIKSLGGGALLDAGGYTLKYAQYLLGESARLLCASTQYIEDFEVEIGGSATMVNDKGVCAQLAFGMDNDYKCSIEMWGSKGAITSDRIFTAPVGFEPFYTLKQNQEYSTYKLPADDTFLKSIRVFVDCMNNKTVRKSEYEEILAQEKLVDDFIRLSR